MDRRTISFRLLLLLCYLLLSPSEGHDFPMKDCRTSKIDLLIVFENYASEFCINRTNNKEFISGVLDVFLAPEEENLTRLHVAVASFTSSGPVMYLPFQNGSREDFVEQIDTMDNCHSNESPLELKSRIQDIHISVNISFQESYGSRLGAKDIVVFLYNYTFFIDMNGDISTMYYDICKSCDYNVFFLTNFGPVFGDDISQPFQGLLTATSMWVMSNSDIALSPGFSHAICNQCGVLWSTLGRVKDKNETVVCYYLDDSEPTDFSDPTDFDEPINYCLVKYNGSLAAIRTNDELSFLNDDILAQLQRLYLDKSNMVRINNEFYLFVYLDVYVSQANLIGAYYLDAENTIQNYPGWIFGDNGRCGAWLLKFPVDSEIFDEIGGKLVIQTNRPTINNQFTRTFKDAPCSEKISHLSYCQYPSTKITTTKRDMVLPKLNDTSISNAFNRGDRWYLNFWKRLYVKGQLLDLTTQSGYPPILYVREHSLLFFCGPDEPSAYKYIPNLHVCDHNQDCFNNLDETICQYRECSRSEYKCPSSYRCIPYEAVCDLFSDCEDGSDEQFCALLYTCGGGHFCGFGQCIPKHWVGDGHIDCIGSDETDENNDESISAVSALNQLERCVFLCNRTQCVYPSQLNDGVVDCQGPEGPLDETIGALQHVSKCRTSNVHRPNVTDWAPLCIYQRDRYGTLLGCRDGSHLQDCVDFTCPDGYLKCSESYCIPTHYFNNWQLDCPMGDDEDAFHNSFLEGYFQCHTTTGPLHPDRVCDGHDDCGDGADEFNCHVSCAEGFTCLLGSVISPAGYPFIEPVTENTLNLIPLTFKTLNFIDYRARYADLSGVNLSSVSSSGTSAQLNHLVYLIMANCSISDVGYGFGDAIGWIGSIYLMNLSYNDIHEIPAKSIFRRTSNLRVLDLSHNRKLTVLGSEAFFGSKKLQELDLSYTSIDTLNYTYFIGLNTLEVLNLSYTLISSMLGNNVYDPKVHGGLKTLDTLDLRGTMIRDFERDTFDGLTIKTNLYTDIFGLCCPDVRGTAIPEHTCHAPVSSVSSCTDLIGDQVQKILMWVAGIIALLGNTLVIVYRLVWEEENLKKPYGLFVVNFGISDFIMGVYLVIIAGADMVYRDVYVWNDREWRYGVTCKIAGFFATLSSETSMFFILLVTLDRLLTIKFPFGKHRISRSGKISLTVGAWLVGLVLSMIPVLPIFDEDNIYTSNALCLGLPLTNDRSDGWYFSMGVFIVFNFTIFLVIAVGQCMIYGAMSSHRSAIAKNSARRAQDIEVAKTLFFVVLSDFLCWFPIGCMGLSALMGNQIGREMYVWSAILILPVNSALNPLLYTIPILVAKWKQFKHG